MSIFENVKRFISGESDPYEDEDMTSAWTATDESYRQRESRQKELQIRTTTQLKVLIVQPHSLDELASVADEMRGMMTIILNVSQMEREPARRMLDVLSGVAYALDSNISRIAVDTYMFLPYNVEFEGVLLDELDRNGLLSRRHFFGAPMHTRTDEYADDFDDFDSL